MRSARETSSALGLGEGVGELAEDDGELGEACPIHDERTSKQKIRTIVETTSRKETFTLLQTTPKNSKS
jgi:hypothetical protein